MLMVIYQTEKLQEELEGFLDMRNHKTWKMQKKFISRQKTIKKLIGNRWRERERECVLVCQL